MSNFDSLSVRVWTTPDAFEDGQIKFTSDDILIELESGRLLSGKDSKLFYEPKTMVSLNDKGKSVVEQIESDVRIHLKPTMMNHHPYVSEGGQFIEDIFPPSTCGFYGRLQAGKHDALYVVQSIENSERSWLTIADIHSNRIYENQIIQPYEAQALTLIEDGIRQVLYSKASSYSKSNKDEILSILNTPAPSPKELARIIKDVSVPNLKIKGTMRDTLSQLIPSSFPEPIRDELMAFLAFVVKSQIPDEDPMVYLYKFASMTLLENLLSNHLMHVLDKSEWPPYVKLMILAERGQLEAPKRAISDWIMESPWFHFSQKCAEMRPNWLNIAIDIAKTLNKSNRVVVGLPTSSNAAKRTKNAWKKRFTEIMHGLRIRGHIESKVLGLTELVYIGSAYRWPHKHMKFISRLGGSIDSSPYLQIMLMPYSAAERVKRALPNALSVSWSLRTSNLGLYNTDTGNWNISIQRILSSLDKKSSMKKLAKQFDEKKVIDSYSLSKTEAKVVDMVSEGTESIYLELPEFLNIWGLTRKEIHTALSTLKKRKLISLTYEVMDSRLISLAVILQGKSEAVTSVVSEFLSGTPTSYARLNQTGENAVVLSRLPEESAYDISSQLTSRGIEQGINIRCMRPTTFRRYTSNLYQRLLKDDGTWDDDVSAFLSQARI